MNLLDQLSEKRRQLKELRPSCPKCGEDFQIQLKEWIEEIIWKCRICKQKWNQCDIEHSQADGYSV